MKQLIFISLLLLFNCQLFSIDSELLNEGQLDSIVSSSVQDLHEYTYIDGLKYLLIDSTCYLLNNSKDTIIKAQCVNQQFNGTYMLYYHSGQISKFIEYINGKREGMLLSYNEQGTLISRHNYQNGILEGVSTYYDHQGNIVYKYCYENGERTLKIDHNFDILSCYPEYMNIDSVDYLYVNGHCYLFEAEKIKIKAACSQQNFLGLYTVYDSTNSIDYTVFYLRGEQNGLFTDYVNNQIASSFQIVNNQKHGLYTEYDSQGNIVRLACYEKDVMTSFSLINFDTFVCSPEESSAVNNNFGN